jgi:hypothetical protein
MLVIKRNIVGDIARANSRTLVSIFFSIAIEIAKAQATALTISFRVSGFKDERGACSANK